MISLQMPQRISCVLPATLIAIRGAQSAAEPTCFVDAQKHAVCLARGAIGVLVRFAPGQRPR